MSERLKQIAVGVIASVLTIMLIAILGMAMKSVREGKLIDLLGGVTEASLSDWKHATEDRLRKLAVDKTESFTMWMSEHNTDSHTAEEIPLDIFTELCADADGCLIQLKLKGWNDRDGLLNVGLSRWMSVIYDSDDGAWTSTHVTYQYGSCYDCVYGRDAFTDNVITKNGRRRDSNHLLQEFYQSGRNPACYLTDREYPPQGDDTDSRRGIHLLSAPASYNVPDRRCGITIRD